MNGDERPQVSLWFAAPADLSGSKREDEGELFAAKDWMKRLLADLDVLGAKYLEAARSGEKVSALDEPAQLLLFAAVGRIASALNEIPQARGNPGLALLSDLAGEDQRAIGTPFVG